MMNTWQIEQIPQVVQNQTFQSSFSGFHGTQCSTVVYIVNRKLEISSQQNKTKQQISTKTKKKLHKLIKCAIKPDLPKK